MPQSVSDISCIRFRVIIIIIVLIKSFLILINGCMFNLINFYYFMNFTIKDVVFQRITKFLTLQHWKLYKVGDHYFSAFKYIVLTAFSCSRSF